MSPVLSLLLSAVVGYLLGCLDFGILLSRLVLKDDVRKYGSGNAGATNMLRVFGLKPAVYTLIGDIVKGMLAVLAGQLLCGGAFGDLVVGRPLQAGAVLGGVLAAVGHCWPCFFGFKGGKAVSTSAGVSVMLDWRIFLIIASVFVLVTLISRYVSLGSCCAAVAIVPAMILFHGSETAALLLIIALAVLVIGRHHTNIRRLVKGTESKLSFKKAGNAK